jgi:hypothetical protein
LLDDDSDGVVKPHVMIWQPKDLVVKARRHPESWYFAHQPKNLGQLSQCCSFRPIAIHFQRQPDDMRQLQYITHDVHDSCYLEMVKRTTAVTEWAKASNDSLVRGVSGQVMVPAAAIREVDYYIKVKNTLKQWRGLSVDTCGADVV